MIMFDDRFEPFCAINATLIGGLSVARNEKDGDASLEVSTGPPLPTAIVPSSQSNLTALSNCNNKKTKKS